MSTRRLLLIELSIIALILVLTKEVSSGGVYARLAKRYRPLTDQPIFKKREIDLARQIIDKPDGSDLILLNKILNGATKVDNGGLALDLKNLKQIMNEMEIDSIPELEEILLEEKRLLMEYLRKTRNVNRPRNSMYVNDILQRLRRK